MAAVPGQSHGDRRRWSRQNHRYNTGSPWNSCPIRMLSDELLYRDRLPNHDAPRTGRSALPGDRVAALASRARIGVRGSLARDDLRNRARSVTAMVSISLPRAGQIRMAVDSRQCVVTVSRACVSLLWRSAPLRAARRARQSVDAPPGGISLGAHRKGQAGVCQREQRSGGYQSQQESAGGCALAGELASGLRVSISRHGCLMGPGEVVPQGRDGRHLGRVEVVPVQAERPSWWATRNDLGKGDDDINAEAVLGFGQVLVEYLQVTDQRHQRTR